MDAPDKLEVLEGQLGRTRIVASWAIALALLALGWGIMAMVVNHNQADSIRDLQLRVTQLESQRN